VDALVRRRRSLLIASVGAASLVAACAGRGPTSGGTVGVSERRANALVRDGRDGGVVDGTIALPPSYRTTFAKVNRARFVSRGHAAGRWEMDVWANETAQKAIASHAREVPVGAVLVAEHFEAASTKGSGPIMLIEKRPPGFSKEHGDWRYVVVGSQGQLVKDGVVEPCAGCHDDAPMDGIFPVAD
jgi:hypothetical protein